jgi:hypothetical protein
MSCSVLLISLLTFHVRFEMLLHLLLIHNFWRHAFDFNKPCMEFLLHLLTCIHSCVFQPIYLLFNIHAYMLYNSDNNYNIIRCIIFRSTNFLYLLCLSNKSIFTKFLGHYSSKPSRLFILFVFL